ncbi:MAG: hypothetical protein MOB07_18635 [Acidobacteria bacterium]|nr:hypothetical protein [Acidobacteriota bacterium]
MKIRIEELGEPELEFGGRSSGINPKLALPDQGPLKASGEKGVRTISLGLVCLPSEEKAVRRWFELMHKPLLNNESNVRRFKEYPGAEKALHCRYEIPDQFVVRLNPQQHEIALARSGSEKFESLLNLYSEAIKSLFSDPRPACILVCFPEEVAALRVTNPRLSYEERMVLERLQREEEAEQMSLFEPTEDQKKLAGELLPQAEELLFRNFHRALKATCMVAQNAIPIQVIRRHTYIPAEAKQSDATRAWNLGVALYYKAGEIPWRPKHLSPDTCFIGISFHHLKRRSGDLVYASVAQAFSNNVEPFALKGASIPREQSRNKRPYLTEDQAGGLMRDVMDKYEKRAGARPSKVIVHKTSRYQPEEDAGFRDGLLDAVAACNLVWMTPTGFRLLRRGMREPDRGTLCTIEDQQHFLFTTGYVPWWAEYPGPHIPSPLEIGVDSDSNLSERAREILTLTKMNWNSADGIGRHPITITFARRVGMIMTEMGEEDVPNPLYRFYM